MSEFFALFNAYELQKLPKSLLQEQQEKVIIIKIDN